MRKKTLKNGFNFLRMEYGQNKKPVGNNVYKK